MAAACARFVCVAVGILGIAACTAKTRQPDDTELAVRAAVATLREATRPFHDVTSAVRAGYAADVAECLVHEHHGAMGYHHLNRSYITRDLAVERPQLLLYERMPDGSYRLNAVEYFIPYSLWPPESSPPVFMGQSMKPEDTLRFWYLHVWAWRQNPEGLFADFHPEVSCPDSARKVYRPNPAN